MHPAASNSPMSAVAQPRFVFDGVVRLTRIGTSYVLLTVFIGFAALNTGNNALYIALAFLLGCLLLSGIASKGGLKHLRVELGAIDQPWAGRAVRSILRVSNDSRIWNVRDVVITTGVLAQPVLIPIITRRASVDVPADLLFARRGVVSLTRLDFYTRYPFGFFLKKRRIPIRGEVIVFPRLADVDRRRERFEHADDGQIDTHRLGHGGDVHAFREYVRGDSLRHIAWKKSASLGRWIIKQTEAETARSVHVVVDPYKPREASDDDLEEMISAATTFVHDAVSRGLDVILTMPRVTVHSKEGDAAPLFRALALVEPIYEAVEVAAERDAVVFSLGRRHDAKTA
jgi:uncharacterized protein (DUF58 family)